MAATHTPAYVLHGKEDQRFEDRRPLAALGATRC